MTPLAATLLSGQFAGRAVMTGARKAVLPSSFGEPGPHRGDISATISGKDGQSIHFEPIRYGKHHARMQIRFNVSQVVSLSSQTMTGTFA